MEDVELKLKVLSFNVLNNSAGLFPIVNLQSHKELIRTIESQQKKTPFSDILSRIYGYKNDPRETLTLMSKVPTNCIYTDKYGSRVSPESGENLSALPRYGREGCKLVAVYNEITKLAKLRESSNSPVGSWSEYDDSGNEGCVPLSNNVTKTLWEGEYCRPHMPLDSTKGYSKARTALLVEYVSYCIMNRKMNVILLQESFEDLETALLIFGDFHWDFQPDLTIGIRKSIVMDKETVYTHSFQNEKMYRLKRDWGTGSYTKSAEGSFIIDTYESVYPRILLNGFKTNQGTYIFIVNVHLKGGHDDNDKHEKAEEIYGVMKKCCEFAKTNDYKKYVIMIGGDFNHDVNTLSDQVSWFAKEEGLLPLTFVEYVMARKPIDGFLLYTFNQTCTMGKTLSTYYYGKVFKKLIEKEEQLGVKLRTLRDIIKNNIFPKNCSDILKLSHPYDDQQYGITGKTSEKNMMTQMSDHYPVGVTIRFSERIPSNLGKRTIPNKNKGAISPRFKLSKLSKKSKKH